MSKKKTPFEKNKDEITYNLINSALAGGLVLVGSLTDGEITTKGFIIAGLASATIMLTKFKEYWAGQAGEYSAKMFNFVH